MCLFVSFYRNLVPEGLLQHLEALGLLNLPLHPGQELLHRARQSGGLGQSWQGSISQVKLVNRGKP